MHARHSTNRRKPRQAKFTLTLHRTGQWCKKIHGKLYYFGTDKDAQGQLPLNRCPSKDFQQELFAPAAAAAFHGDAVFAGMLFEQ